MRWKAIAVALLTLGLAASACESKQTESDKETDEKAAPSEPAEDKQADEDKADEKEEGEGEEEAAADTEVTEEVFLTVSYELTCVDQELAGEIEEEELREKILGKHGIEAEAYEAAEDKFADNEELAEKVDERLKDCNEQVARRLAGLEEGGDKAEAKEDKPKPAPRPKFTGTATGTVTNTGGFDRAILKVTVTPSWKANGTFSGKRDKGFQVPLTGKVSEDGSITLTGDSGQNNVTVSGKVVSDGVNGTVKGEVYGKPMSLSIQAR